MLPCLLKQIYLRNSILFRDKGSVLPETSRAKKEVWIKKPLVCQKLPLVQDAQMAAGPHQLLSSGVPLPTAVPPFPAPSKHISVHGSSQTGGGKATCRHPKRKGFPENSRCTKGKHTCVYHGQEQNPRATVLLQLLSYSYEQVRKSSRGPD